MNSIYTEIENERAYQRDKWGDTNDDLYNRPNDWVAYISHHSTRWFTGGFPPYTKAHLSVFRRQMVKVAALAVAAIEWCDRLADGRNKRPDVVAD